MDAQNTADLVRLLEANREVLARLCETISNNAHVGTLRPRSVSIKPHRRVDGHHVQDDTPMTSLDDPNPSPVLKVLKSASYDEFDFKAHLCDYPWPQQLLDYLSNSFKEFHIYNRNRLFHPHAVPLTLQQYYAEADKDPARATHWDIFDVCLAGAVIPIPGSVETGLTKASAVFTKLAKVNPNFREEKAYGRVIIIRDPSPMIFANVHMALSLFFDMDEIFALLVDPRKAMVALPHRAFSEDTRKQRSFVVRFNHLTRVGECREPLQWQPKSDSAGWLPKEMSLSRCSVVVAMSLEGEPLAAIKNTNQRRVNRQFGYVFDPLSAWRVVSVEMCPDWHADADALVTRFDETSGLSSSPRHGPEVFATALIVALKDVRKRLRSVHDCVASLASPEPDAIFQRELQDRLLFDDEHFSYSRRYLMAHQTLGILNQEIDEVLSEIRLQFPDEVWEGSNTIVWPTSEGASPIQDEFRRKMRLNRVAFEYEVQEFQTLEKLNADKQKEIKALFDTLYNMTSVLENRRSVRAADAALQQNRNIKLLTLVTIFFLPLSFSTSIYGMNNMPTNADFTNFAWVTVAVCVPTYLLIASLTPSNPFGFWTRVVKEKLDTMGWSLGSSQRRSPDGSTGSNFDCADSSTADISGGNPSDRSFDRMMRSKEYLSMFKSKDATKEKNAADAAC